MFKNRKDQNPDGYEPEDYEEDFETDDVEETEEGYEDDAYEDEDYEYPARQKRSRRDLDDDDEEDDDDDYLGKTSFVVGKLLPGLIGILLIVLLGSVCYQFVLKDKLDGLFSKTSSTQTAETSVTPTAAPTATPTPTAVATPVPTQEVEEDTSSMIFSDTEETVTARDSVNLRSTPSHTNDHNIVGILYNGETAVCTGTSEEGWSRLSYQGTECYAVTSYLTDELGYANSYADNNGENDGIATQFEEISDEVTPKEEVNLRSIPSVTNPDSEVVATIEAGEIITRTGINSDVGWSRVEYDGQTLYCISSYVTEP